MKNPHTRILTTGKSPSYSRLLKTYSQGYISVCIYLNVVNSKNYYDTVILRRVRVKGNCKQEWRRGANLKPTDLQDLIPLLKEVQEYFENLGLYDEDPSQVQ